MNQSRVYSSFIRAHVQYCN